MKSYSKETILILACFAATYIIWGTTYLFSAIAIKELPPFLMAGIRYTVAGVLLSILALAFGKIQPITRKQFKSSIYSGILILAIGSGTVFWSLQFVDTGFMALVISGEPLIIVLLMWLLQKKKPPMQAWIGIFLGIIGMYLLVSQKTLVSSPEQWKGLLGILFSMLCWGLGVLYVGKADLPKPHIVNSAIQMTIGGILLLIFSVWFERPGLIEWTSLSQETWGSLFMLIIFGSVITYSAFNYLLTKVSPEKVSTNTYVNPIVAMLLGWWILGEIITSQSVMAAMIMLIGVFFINTKPEQTKRLLQNVRFKLMPFRNK